MRSNNNLNDVTIVIPSIGRNNDLDETIKFLNKGKKKPKQIVAVIPKAELIDLNLSNYKNLIIYVSDQYGQVNQRIHGFNLSKTKFTLQLDDDCFISQNNILELKKSLIQLGKKNCIGPIFFSKSNQPLHKYNNSFLSNILSLFFEIPMGKKKMGKTNYMNLNYGIDPNICKDDLTNVEWIPGGCKLMYTSELIKENYYKFSGKAYYEDIIHSRLLKEKQIKMWISKKSTCKTDTVNFTYKEIPFIKNIVRSNFGNKFFKYWIWLLLVKLKKSI